MQYTVLRVVFVERILLAPIAAVFFSESFRRIGAGGLFIEA